MNNVIYLNNDPIIIELSNAVDKCATKKMLAYKYFNNNENLTNEQIDYIMNKIKVFFAKK